MTRGIPSSHKYDATGLRYKVRFKLLRPTATTSGKIEIYVGSDPIATSPWNSAVVLNVADYAADTWHQLEVYLEPLAAEVTGNSPLTLGVRACPDTGAQPNGKVYLGDFAMWEAKDGGPLWQKIGSSYTIKSDDNGQHISLSSGGVTVPTDANMPVTNGFIVSIYNATGAAQNITSSMQLRLAGTATAGTSRSIAAYGIATLMKVSSGYWAVSGPGVT